jgi:hypothetical protein
MARLYQAEIQVITDDNVDSTKVQSQLEKALGPLKVADVFVREVNYAGNLEDPLDDFEDDSDN